MRSPGVSLSFLIFLLLSTFANATVKTPFSTSEDFLNPHNEARATVRVPLLSWSEKLASYAQSYANNRTSDCALKHSNGTYGENIFWGSGTEWTPANAVADWVGEKQWYNYSSNSCAKNQQCGHYTQVVWKNSTELGCGRVNCDQGKGVFMICSYNPPGNYLGEKPY